jgi:hypothetical protein
MKIQTQINAYDAKVEDVKVCNPVKSRKYFVGNSEDITRDNHHDKKGTFPFYCLGTQGFNDGQGPADRKAQKHHHFANFTKCFHSA